MKLRSTTPEDGESLLGFLRRLAAMNAYAHLGDFLSLVEVRYGRPMLEDLPSLAGKLGVDVGVLERIAPHSNPDFATLDWRFQRSEVDPFCPACTQDGRVWKQSWRHSLVSACPEHGLVLQGQCPRCGVTPSSTKGGFRTCECGYQLRDFQRVEATAGEVQIANASSRLLAVKAWKRTSAHGKLTCPAISAGFCSFWQHLIIPRAQTNQAR